jgi:hypothetical protein
MRGTYRVARGQNRNGLKLETVLVQGGFIHAAESLQPRHADELARAMTELFRTFGIDWQTSVGWGEDALALLQKMSRNLNGWRSRLIRVYLPMDFEHRRSRAARGMPSGSTRRRRTGYWTPLRLVEAMRLHPMTGKELAKHLNVTPAAVSKLRNAQDNRPLPAARQAQLDTIFGRKPGDSISRRNSLLGGGNRVESTS